MSVMNLKENLKAVKVQMEKAAKDAGLNECTSKLIAVSKVRTTEEIIALIESGQRLFGENRVQEAMSKWPALKEKYADIQLHLIGPLQSNKAKEAVQIFDVIQTIDRSKIAKAIAKEMKAQGKTLELFIQINTGAESQKSGVLPGNFHGLYDLCTKELGLKIKGLMCIPPFDQEPSPHFALLKKMAKEAGGLQCSMGMSDDFQTAVQFRADYIRVGTAIFGSRS